VNKDNNLKVAIVCDWLNGIGGAELVVLQLHKMFPNAPIYTSQYDPKKIDWFNDADVRTTWVNMLPGKLKKFLPVLRAFSFSHLNLKEFDLVISSTGAEAKAVKFNKNATHISYCHSPTHYYWVRYDEYLKNPGFGKLDWLARIGLKTLVGPMKKWDFKAAQNPSYLLTNSNFSKSNILKYYKRESTVIYPPVDVATYSQNVNDSSNRDGYIVIGRQTPYKFFGLAVEACTKLNKKLVVIGDGPENSRLKSIAGPTIQFLGQIDNKQKLENLNNSKALIFPGIDDFGITAIEAMAAGTPVIAFKAGGALDYVDQTNGLFFEEQTVESLCRAINLMEQTSFDSQKVSLSVSHFSPVNFEQKLSDFINNL